jgi:hypothetical protein
MLTTAEKAQDEASVSTDSGRGVGDATAVPRQTGFLAKLRRFEERLDAKLGIESEAISRKLPEDKGHVPWHHQLNMFFLWASGTMNTSCFATGFLGHEFGLSKKTCLFFCALATAWLILLVFLQRSARVSSLPFLRLSLVARRRASRPLLVRRRD